MRLEITAVGEVVDVPAGRFVCARVDGSNTYHDGRVAKSTSWYAPHVGLVKSTANGGTELLAFASRPSTTTVDEVLTNALRDAGVVSVARQWYGVTDRRAQLGLRSEFARVQEPDGARLWRVLDDVATRFDPAAVEDWRRLVDEEGIDLVGSGTAAMAPALLASAAAVLRVFTYDPTMKVTGQGTSTTKYEGKDRRVVAVTVVRPDDARVTATFTIDGAEIDSVQITR